MQHLSRQLTKGIVMKTVGEFKKAGLVFVKNDTPDGIMKVSSIGAASLNSNDCFDGMEVVGEFAWRENTGVKPEFIGLVEWVGDSGAVYVNRPDELIWSDKCIAKWRPSLNQPSLSVESDTKESAIHKAWVALKGDLKNVRGLEGDDNVVVICLSKVGVFNAGDYSTFEWYVGGSNKHWKVICTIKEFTDYCEKMAAEEKRMDIIGQNGNDGLHYDNTAQQVEVIVNNNTPFSIELAEKGGFSYEFKAAVSGDKPIFTQAMAGAGELPPVGSKCMYSLGESKNWFECEILMHVGTQGVVMACDVFEGMQFSPLNGKYAAKFKPLDTRTDREKAIDAAMTDIGAEHGDRASVASVVECMIAAGYSKC